MAHFIPVYLPAIDHVIGHRYRAHITLAWCLPRVYLGSHLVGYVCVM